MAEILVVYFSRSGTTRQAAEAIAAACGADLEPIEEARSRRGLFGYLRSAREARARAKPPILPGRHDPANYKLVAIGGPVWVQNCAAPLRSWIAEHRGAVRQAAFFVTEGGSGGTAAMAEIGAALGHHPVARLELTRRALHRGLAKVDIAEYAARLKAAVAETRAESVAA